MLLVETFFFQLQVVPGQKTVSREMAGLHLQLEQLRISLSTETGKKRIYFRSDSVSFDIWLSLICQWSLLSSVHPPQLVFIGCGFLGEWEWMTVEMLSISWTEAWQSPLPPYCGCSSCTGWTTGSECGKMGLNFQKAADTDTWISRLTTSPNL